MSLLQRAISHDSSLKSHSNNSRINASTLFQLKSIRLKLKKYTRPLLLIDNYQHQPIPPPPQSQVDVFEFEEDFSSCTTSTNAGVSNNSKKCDDSIMSDYEIGDKENKTDSTNVSIVKAPIDNDHELDEEEEEEEGDKENINMDMAKKIAKLAASIIKKDGRELFGGVPSRRIPIANIVRSNINNNRFFA